MILKQNLKGEPCIKFGQPRQNIVYGLKRNKYHFQMRYTNKVTYFFD